jgi:hypothetical protein
LQQYNHEGDNFLSHTIIWDETWNHHYGSENKWQSMQWKHMSSPLQQRVVTWTVATLCCKVLVDNVLGLQRANPQTLYGERYIVTSVNYCDMLRNEVTLAAHTKQTGRLSQGIVLLHKKCKPSYDTPHHQHHSESSLGSSRATCP